MKKTDKVLQEFKKEYPHRDFDKHCCKKSGHFNLLLDVYDTKEFFQTKNICIVCKHISLSKKESPLNEDEIEIYEDED